jgi:hypothetical protein
MSKIFSFYNKNDSGADIEKVWYNSSNVIYSECIDYENKPKTLKIVFSNGTQYQYNDVNVNDYIVFKNDISQGKALNRLIKEKKYEYVKLENADLNAIEEELFFRSNKGFYIENNKDEGYFEIKNSSNESVFKLTNSLEDGYFEMVNDILKAVGINVKTIEEKNG